MQDNRTILTKKQIGHDANNVKTALGDDVSHFSRLPRAFGIENAPKDGGVYSRHMGVWQRIIPITPSL